MLTDVSPKESSGYWRYYEPGTGAWLWFAVYTPEAGEVATNVDGASDAGENHTTVTVQGYQADLFQSEGTILLTWQNEAGYLFMLRATDFGDTETLLSMAEGVVPYEGPGVAWEMGWVPEGYEPMYRDEGAGAVQQVWVRDGTTLTWQYVTDPICPFETPEGEPEELDDPAGRHRLVLDGGGGAGGERWPHHYCEWGGDSGGGLLRHRRRRHHHHRRLPGHRGDRHSDLDGPGHQHDLLPGGGPGPL